MDTAQIDSLRQKIQSANLPTDVLERLNQEVSRVELAVKSQNFTPEVDREITYINFCLSLPWSNTSQDILDLKRSRQILDKNHFGLEAVKERILEYLSILILNHQKGTQSHSPILAFLGLVGSGKTSLSYAIAESLGRSIIRIPFGGLGSAAQLRGQSRTQADAEPGLIVKALQRAKFKNPVILLDELDRITESARADIMGVLVEILDPEQNSAFLDHYLDIPVDLSKVLFVATANNTANLATAVLDRLEIIEMPFYTDDQKIAIGRDYLLPQALKEAGLEKGVIVIEPNLWPEVVRPLGFDGGIRSLKRNIDSVVRKVALKVVEGNAGPYNITAENIKEYLNG
jgi:ATP-dependent Lon protease